MNVCLSDKILLESYFRVNRPRAFDLLKYWDGIANEVITRTSHGPTLSNVREKQELWEFGVLVAAAGPSLNLTISAEAELISFRRNIAEQHRQMDQ
jgi:hypothetical protein